ELGELARAIADYNRYIELRPDDPMGHDYLARVLLYADDPNLRDVPLALKHSEWACRLAAESDYQSLSTLAAAYGASGRYRDAAASQEKAIELASRDPEAKMLWVPGMKETLAQYVANNRGNR